MPRHLAPPQQQFPTATLPLDPVFAAYRSQTQIFVSNETANSEQTDVASTPASQRGRVDSFSLSILTYEPPLNNLSYTQQSPSTRRKAMAAIPVVRRRPFNTRGRNSATPQHRGATVESASLSEPPLKKRKYIPGGPGGGGRYVDADGKEVAVPRSVAVGPPSTGPRTRVGSHHAANGTPFLAQADRAERPERPRRTIQREQQPTPRARYSSAAAVAAAVVQGDGFKPREERGWEEFHQDLEIDAELPVFGSELVDGIVKAAAAPTSTPTATDTMTNGVHSGEEMRGGAEGDEPESATKPPNLDEVSTIPIPIMTPPQPIKRRPGRPPRRPDAILKAMGQDTPKSVPLPGPNPRERLTLPKPSFRRADPFVLFEKTTGSIDYVDRTMAHVGYQESDHFIRPERGLIRWTEGGVEEDLDLVPTASGSAAAASDGGEANANAAIGSTGVGRVEYDMDEQDQKWLEAYNLVRRAEQVEPIKPAIFEITMTKIEKEWHALEKRIPKPNPKPPQTHRPRSSSAAAVNGEPQSEEQDSKCAICDDGDCENTNAIVFCDGCDLAVHQECYGVPFIPEGQWHCRRCQLVGRGVPTCIFCPNTDGAFKQTNSSKWAHLLCAIWIPEVCLGNNTFMEPVMDVEKVPKSRWKLKCAICQQQMGACIQCGNKNCYRAFHVTCGRRAKWCLQNKSAPGSAKLESTSLKAYCDKHVPDEWRETYDVDGATTDAIAFYKYHMRGKVWTDSRQSAMDITASQPVLEAPLPTIEDPGPKGGASGGGGGGGPKRKKGQTGKSVWRLPSGAPVVPATLYESLEAALARFTVRKRKEFAADVCRYWTLKREAKRGAALIKRLQLQMETFSSMEITRRNYAGMGAAGAARLRRRIEFAEARLREVEALRELCRLVREREALKLQDAELLRDLVNIVYFPVPPLLWPIMEKALALDNKGIFHSGLARIREALGKRAYASVTPFSKDLGSALTSVIGMDSITDPNQIESQIVEDRATKKTLTSEDKDNRKLARRVIKAVQVALDDANRKESELCRLPYEKELLDFDQLLEKSIASRHFAEVNALQDSLTEASMRDLPMTDVAVESSAGDLIDPVGVLTNGDAQDAASPSQIEATATETLSGLATIKQSSPHDQLTPSSSAPFANGVPATEADPLPTTAAAALSPPKPPTPPLSAPDEPQTAISAGGVPWYMEPFDPRGTTVYEERWTGREVARGMSEELSDMDEDELSGLVDGDDFMVEAEAAEDVGMGKGGGSGKAEVLASAKKKNGKTKKRWRGFK